MMPDNAMAGDIVFAHSHGLVGRLIRISEYVRWRSGKRWNHAAILEQKSGDTWSVIQMETFGCKRRTLDQVAPKGGYTLIAPAPLDDRGREIAVNFARNQLGTKYGFLTILSIFADLFTPNFFHIDLRRDKTFICSALVANSMFNGGWEPPKGTDLYQISPAQLAEAVGVDNGPST